MPCSGGGSVGARKGPGIVPEWSLARREGAALLNVLDMALQVRIAPRADAPAEPEASLGTVRDHLRDRGRKWSSVLVDKDPHRHRRPGRNAGPQIATYPCLGLCMVNTLTCMDGLGGHGVATDGNSRNA